MRQLRLATRLAVALVFVLVPGRAAAQAPMRQGMPKATWKPIDLRIAARRLLTTQGVPTHFQLWSSVRVPRSQLFVRAAASFRLGAADAMVEVSARQGKRGYTHSRFQQTSAGVPVENGVYALTERDGAVVAGGGRLAPDLAVDPTPAVSEADALATALAAVGATEYRWQSDPAGTPPAAKPVIHSPDFGATKPFRLAYRFLVATSLPDWDTFVVYVDAKTGALIESRSTSVGIDAPATGTTFAGDAVSFVADRDGSTYRLEENATRLIRTLDKPANAPLQDFLDADNHWDEVPNRRGVSAHWAAEKFWDYFVQQFDRHGPDGRGTAPDARGIVIQEWSAGCGSHPGGTHYSPSDQTIYLCRAWQVGVPMVDLQVVAHEAGHAVAFYAMTGFQTFLESRGIGESLADVIGNSVHAFATGLTDDWIMPLGGRDLAHPKNKQQPDTYGGELWAAAVAAGDYHALTGVGNRWFYLLASGGAGTNDLGSPYDVAGIGRGLAEQIAIHALLDKLTPLATYADYRAQSLATAGELFGEGSAEQAAAAAAWDAVGVLDPAARAGLRLTPPNGAAGVPAWPATLEWSEPPASGPGPAVRAGGTRWMVQLSRDPQFLTGVQPLDPKTAPTLAPGGTVVSYATRDLEPRTVYYWRLKALRNGQWDASWTTTAAFETSGMAPRNVTPRHAAAEVHPWKASFTWDKVDGATQYHVIVGLDASLATEVSTDDPVEPHSETLVLRTDRQYFWSVRATGGFHTEGELASAFHSAGRHLDSPDDLERPWSPAESLAFTTSLPSVTFEAPTNAAAAYPWPVVLSWQAVTGAAGYDVEISAAGTADFNDVQAKRVDAPELSAQIDVKPELNKRYHWRVRALGPDLFPERRGEGEPGRWSNAAGPDGQYFVMDDESTPKILLPSTAPPAPFDGLQLSWSKVTGALSYEWALYRIDKGVLAPIENGPLGGTAVGLTNPLEPQQDYYWTVHAVGPQQLEGMERASTFTTAPPTPCNTTVVAGGALPDRKTFELGKTKGGLTLLFKTYDVHDRIDVFLAESAPDSPFLSTGCVATPDPDPDDLSRAPWTSLPANFNSRSSRVTVVVTPNCNPETADPATQWTYEIGCP